MRILRRECDESDVCGAIESDEGILGVATSECVMNAPPSRRISELRLAANAAAGALMSFDSILRVVARSWEPIDAAAAAKLQSSSDTASNVR